MRFVILTGVVPSVTSFQDRPPQLRHEVFLMGSISWRPMSCRYTQPPRFEGPLLAATLLLALGTEELPAERSLHFTLNQEPSAFTVPDRARSVGVRRNPSTIASVRLDQLSVSSQVVPENESRRLLFIIFVFKMKSTENILIFGGRTWKAPFLRILMRCAPLRSGLRPTLCSASLQKYLSSMKFGFREMRLHFSPTEAIVATDVFFQSECSQYSQVPLLLPGPSSHGHLQTALFWPRSQLIWRGCVAQRHSLRLRSGHREPAVRPARLPACLCPARRPPCRRFLDPCRNPP